jgi:predicted ABC-type transport system involved in lysophospholipase L1 biosynthesis ATPase subunit
VLDVRMRRTGQGAGALPPPAGCPVRTGGEAAGRACARGLLILDEPTSRLDEQAAGRIAELLVTATRERAQTIICAGHDEQLIDRGDSVITLSD